MLNEFAKVFERKVWYVLVVDKSTDHIKPHFDLFFTTLSTSKKLFFFRARAEKGISRHTDASSVVWTLIKLANQIARFFAIVVKRAVTRHFCRGDCAWFSPDEIASCRGNSPRKWQVCYGCREKGYRSFKTWWQPSRFSVCETPVMY